MKTLQKGSHSTFNCVCVAALNPHHSHPGCILHEQDFFLLGGAIIHHVVVKADFIYQHRSVKTENCDTFVVSLLLWRKVRGGKEWGENIAGLKGACFAGVFLLFFPLMDNKCGEDRTDLSHSFSSTGIHPSQNLCRA